MKTTLLLAAAAAASLVLATSAEPRSTAPISQLVSVGLDGSDPRDLTAGVGDGDVAPAVGPQGRIAFVRNVRLGFPELRVMEATGGDSRFLSQAAEETFYPPAWSPTGRELAFQTWDFAQCYPTSRNCATSLISVVDLASGAVRTATRTSDRGAGSFSWSPDGTRLAYAGELDFDLNARTVETSRTDRTGRRVLVRLRSGGVTDVAWSPRGDRIAYVWSGWIWLVRPSGGAPVKLVRGSVPRWSPRGDRLLYRASGALRLLDPATKRTRLVVRTPPLPVWRDPATWSPDGRRIALPVWGEGSTSTIVVVRAADGRVLHRHQIKGRITTLSFTPDGGRLVYAASLA